MRSVCGSLDAATVMWLYTVLSAFPLQPYILSVCTSLTKHGKDLLDASNHATGVTDIARVTERHGIRSDMGYGVTWDTERHGIRSDMGYGMTWDTELHGIWIRRMFCLGGYLYKDLRVSRSYVFYHHRISSSFPVFTIRIRAGDQTDVYFLLDQTQLLGNPSGLFARMAPS